MATRKLDLEKHALWREHLKALKESGLSLPEFCRLNSLNLHTLRFWQKNILKSNEFVSNNRSEIPRSDQKAKPKLRPKKPKRVNFAQVSIADNSQIQVVAEKIEPENFRVFSVEIATPKGFLIRVAVAADAASLAMVIRATEHALC
ncbi:MAG: hypothetical protein P4L53_18385 [Candidatus Obscuribacterales bacterium]|nr:hypothetical protein [Candidatus Obscuribacterales bacterium]